MRDESAFEGAAFLGLARDAKRDPYRLSLFGKHLESDEKPAAVLPIHDGTLLVTDRRVLTLRPHLDVYGSWNVRQFLGYEVERSIPRTDIRSVEHRVAPPARTRDGYREVEERLVLRVADAAIEVLVGRGAAPTLNEEDLRVFRAALAGPHPK